MRLAVQFMQAMPCGPRFGQTISYRAEATQEGKGDEEQGGKPDAIRGQWLGQDGKPHAHRTNLPDSRHHESHIST
jgi:hypothetical protein